MLMVNQLIGFGAGASLPPSIEFLQATDNASDATTYTFASQNLGLEDPTRRIVAVFHWRSATVVRTLVSATLNGVAATVHNTVSTSSAPRGVGICSALVPTGTSGSCSFTLSGAAIHGYLGLYRALNEVSASPTSAPTDNTLSGSSLSVLVDIASFGWVVAGASHTGSSGVTFSWTGATERYDVADSEAAGAHYSGASESALAAETGRTITSTMTSASEAALAAVSWG